jgi:hypothetical protein
MNMTTTEETLRAEVQAIQERMNTLQRMKEWNYASWVCEVGDHDWGGMHITHIEPGLITTDEYCEICGLRRSREYTTSKTEMVDEFAEFRTEKPADPEPKTSETADKPTLPLEQTSQSDGTYRVDVSEILGQNKEE